MICSPLPRVPCVFLLHITLMSLQVSSESGWSPDPEFFARRKYKKTEWGWFPVEDAFGGGESSLSPASQR